VPATCLASHAILLPAVASLSSLWFGARARGLPGRSLCAARAVTQPAKSADVAFPPSVAAPFRDRREAACRPGAGLARASDAKGKTLMTADAGELTLTARNSSIEDLVALLRGQQARKVDVVAPASAIRTEGGLIMLDGTVPQLTEDGVTMTAGAYRPTDVCDAGIADKLGIPAGYLKRMRASRPGLFDANVNGWLAGDDRSFFVRWALPATGRVHVR
jgi:hypothetical protein